MLRCFLCLILLLNSSVILAAPVFPELTGRVVDAAGVLSASDQTRIQSQLEQQENETSNQVVVVTLQSLQGYAISDYGYQLGRHWQIGQKDRDNGVLLIIAPNDRKVRIEVGYGLEGDLTDALSHNIIQTQILPHFRQGDYAAGVQAGVDAILQAVAGTYQPIIHQASPWPPILMFLLILLVFYLMSRYGKPMRRQYRNGRTSRRNFPGNGGFGGGLGGGLGGGGFGGGGFGGGGFGGGGGGFGGGGASGGW